MTVTLRPITRENLRECLRLHVAPDQDEFVASNAVSLAQCYVFSDWQPRAIYADDTMVGFLLYDPADADSDEAGAVWIHRLMIGQQHQGQGYGRAAMQAALAEIRARPDCQRIKISFVPANTAAERLYASLGFARTGRILDEEVEMLLEV